MTDHPLSPANAAETVGGLQAWLLGPGLRILIILIVAGVLRVAIGWLIRRTVRTLSTSQEKLRSATTGLLRRAERDEPARARERALAELASNRREQRARTLSSVLRNLATVLVWGIAAAMILSELGIDIGPLLAGVGVVGLAAGIGAQTIIKDVIAGVMMLFEDLVGVGDLVDLEYATGTVENVTLRVTQLRDADGTLWTVRNGEVIRIGNKSLGWSNAVVKLSMAPAVSYRRVREVLEDVGAEFSQDSEWAPLVLDAPSVGRVESVDASQFTLRMTVKIVPGKQWDVETELRRRIRQRFAEEALPFARPAAESLFAGQA